MLHAPRGPPGDAFMPGVPCRPIQFHQPQEIPMKILYINNDGGGFADYIHIVSDTTVQSLFAQRLPELPGSPLPVVHGDLPALCGAGVRDVCGRGSVPRVSGGT